MIQSTVHLNSELAVLSLQYKCRRHWSPPAAIPYSPINHFHSISLQDQDPALWCSS